MIADEHRERVFTKGAFLVDGFVRGTWRIARQRNAATLQLEPFRPLSKKDANAVTREGMRLLSFRSGGSGSAGRADRRCGLKHDARKPERASRERMAKVRRLGAQFGIELRLVRALFDIEDAREN